MTTPELASRLRATLLRSSRRICRPNGDGIPPVVVSALAALAHDGPMKPSRLAEHESIRRPTATMLIARMQEHGLAIRERDPDDGRSFRVSITPRGREVLDHVRRRRDNSLAEAIARLDASDRIVLERAVVLLEEMTRCTHDPDEGPRALRIRSGKEVPAR